MMSDTKFDVNAIVLDTVGRVVLSDERLRFLEQICDVATAGGTTENILCQCGMDGSECTDWGDCGCVPIDWYWCS